MPESIKIFAPASVANVGCGYDTIGFAITGLGDEITVTKRDDEKLIVKEIIGADLPLEADQNVCTIGIQAMLNHLHSKQGFDITIKKLFKPGSGLGSSASSAAGGVFAVNELLGNPLSKEALLEFALEGEAFASKCYHADNVGPSLLGGFQVIRSYDPLDTFKVPVPEALQVLIIFPDVVIKTAESKALIPKVLDIKTARDQWSNVAGLIHALHTADYELLKQSIVDYVAEPVRSGMIPGYDEVKKIVFDHSAVGFNISGSGPSMFALFNDDHKIAAAEKDIKKLYQSKKLNLILHRAKLNNEGCQVIGL
ncbi:MAG: homoserine kinase [Cyclobacteriaceae bacterium]|jgi:homoserine kinase